MVDFSRTDKVLELIETEAERISGLGDIRDELASRLSGLRDLEANLVKLQASLAELSSASISELQELRRTAAKMKDSLDQSITQAETKAEAQFRKIIEDINSRMTRNEETVQQGVQRILEESNRSLESKMGALQGEQTKLPEAVSGRIASQTQPALLLSGLNLILLLILLIDSLN